jgi:hypothetical protein
MSVPTELRDVSPGLWIWRVEHPDWSPEAEWEPFVASTCVASAGEVALLDPIAPRDEAAELWERLDASPPTLIVVLKPDHVRDVDVFVRRYGARAFGPSLFWRHDIPETDLEPIEPVSSLPGGLVALSMAAAGTRRRSGFPSSVRLCSRTRSPPLRESFASGRRPGTKSACCRRSARCSSFRSST